MELTIEQKIELLGSLLIKQPPIEQSLNEQLSKIKIYDKIKEDDVKKQSEESPTNKKLRMIMNEIADKLNRQDRIVTPYYDSENKVYHILNAETIRPEQNIIDNNLISGFVYNDNKRFELHIKKNIDETNIEKLLIKYDLFYKVIKEEKHTEITIYPYADKNLLNIKANPTYSGNIQVLQGEYAITHAEDDNPILSTFGIYTCKGILLFNPEQKVAALAHIDHESGIMPTVEEMIEELKQYGSNNLIFGRTKNLDGLIERVILGKYGPFIDTIYLPSNFSFDSRTGELKEHQYTHDDITINKRFKRVDHRQENHITFCFPTYIANKK